MTKNEINNYIINLRNKIKMLNEKIKEAKEINMENTDYINAMYEEINKTEKEVKYYEELYFQEEEKEKE